jgi:hypothetical protein
MQINMFAKKVTTVDGIMHICSICEARFIPVNEQDTVCGKCIDSQSSAGVVNDE